MIMDATVLVDTKAEDDNAVVAIDVLVAVK